MGTRETHGGGRIALILKLQRAYDRGVCRGLGGITIGEVSLSHAVLLDAPDLISYVVNGPLCLNHGVGTCFVGKEEASDFRLLSFHFPSFVTTCILVSYNCII